MDRLACVAVPLFALAARLRSEPELRGEAVAILAGNGSAARVIAATKVARRAGVRPGVTLLQARALLPKLVARGRDAACERAAQEALFETAETFSPRVEDAGEGVVLLEINGCERHFPGATPEHDLGHALMLAAGRTDLPCGVGIASSKLAARVAAALPSSPTVVPAGDEARFLAPLPPARLAPEIDLAETLARWGIRSVGDPPRLPKDEVTRRPGVLGQRLHQTARGLDPQPLVPRLPPPDFREGLEMEWPLVALEPFLFASRAALERLTQRLETRALSCARLGFELRLEPDGLHVRAIALPAPTRDVKALLTLLRLDLEANPPGGAVVGFTLIAYPDRPRESQLSLLGPADLSPDRLATLLARMFALLGPGRVGSPQVVDGHLPERAALVDFDPPAPPRVRAEPRPGRGLLAVRVLRPAIEIEVITDGKAPEGNMPEELEPSAFSQPVARPIALRPTAASAAMHSSHYPIAPTNGHGKRHAVAVRPRIEGTVRVASGPWNLEESWWSEQPVARDYWDVELTEGGVYRIYRDRTAGSWFADGVYD